MACYFVHLRDGSDEILDPEGVEYDSLEELRKAVLVSARDVIAGDAHLRDVNLAQRIDGETETSDIVYTLEFEEAVPVSRGPST